MGLQIKITYFPYAEVEGKVRKNSNSYCLKKIIINTDSIIAILPKKDASIFSYRYCLSQ